MKIKKINPDTKTEELERDDIITNKFNENRKGEVFGKYYCEFNYLNNKLTGG